MCLWKYVSIFWCVLLHATGYTSSCILSCHISKYSYLTSLIHKFGFGNIHFIDAIIMFVIIPTVHLKNDAETKYSILEKGWCNSIRHLLGIYETKKDKNISDGNITKRIKNGVWSPFKYVASVCSWNTFLYFIVFGTDLLCKKMF